MMEKQGADRLDSEHQSMQRQMVKLNARNAELEKAVEDARAHLNHLEKLAAIDRVIRCETDLEKALQAILKTTQDIFQSDRAWLLYPCDPEADSWHVPMEVSRPEYTGALLPGKAVAMTQDVRESFAELLAADGPITCDLSPSEPQWDPDDTFVVRATLSMALFPKVGKPWDFGLHQCSHRRTWTEEEKRLFQAIGYRIAEALSNMLLLKNLAESEEHYKNLYETALVGLWRTRIGDGAFIKANQTTAELLGYDSVEELKANSKASELYPPDVRKTYVEQLKLNGYASGMETRYVLKDGTEKDISVSARIFPYKGYIEGVIIDITERKRAERQLAQVQRLLEAVIEQSPIPIVIASPQGQLVVFNQACRKQLLIEIDDDVRQGVNLLEMAPTWKDYDRDGNFVPTGKLPLALALEGKTTRNMELRVVRKDGTERWEIANGGPVYDDQGNLIAAFVAFPDITQQKMAEEALRAEKEFTDFALNAQTDTFFVFETTTGKAIRWNRAFNRISGYSDEEIRSLKAPESYYSAEDLQKAAAVMEKVYAEGASTVVISLVAKDGRCIPTEYSVSLLGDSEGRPEYMVSVGRDVSERNRTEAKRTQLEAQLHQAQKMESLGTLAGGIAHDFNNLLMGIQGNASLLLLESEMPMGSLEKLKNIERYVRRGVDLTRQLLGLARSGKYEIKPTDPNELIRDCAAMFGRTKKEIHIHTHLTDGTWTVEVDKGQIDQVLLNLFVNAWQAMPSGGDLYIRTTNEFLNEDDVRPHGAAPGRYVKATVTDTGTGMDKAIQERIFDPFFTTKEMGRGTGLGLASAYGIVKNHDGFIGVDSEPGKGTTFTIFLPASDKQPTAKVREKDELLGGNETILFVDDEEMVIDVGKQLLENLGYTVKTAFSGLEALARMDETGSVVDLVILDMIMPDMGGGETFDRIKSASPGTRVLLSSGYSIDGEASEILARGCDGFIQKPFNLKKLSQKIRRILDSPA
ncbi:MAG: PAS domain S-box protein [Desulfobacterales bacterium]|nr:PAS domain S-box protein [Desulfobacterales bacterium]